MTLQIRKPAETDKMALIDFREACLKMSTQIPGTSELAQYSQIDDWLTAIGKNEVDPAPQLVPSIQYVIVDDQQPNVIIGMLNLRLELNDYLMNFGGHIGYAIHPNQRRRGNGTQMLALGLGKASDYQLQHVLITCAESNIGSARVIEKNGGILEDKRLDPADKLIRRYWIDL